MIESLHITNFQSHADTNMEFHSGVNIIVGSTDSGKSAIIRAIHWISRNRPSGNAIRSWWEGETSVTIKTEENAVSRIKGKTDLYKLTGRERSLKFKAFGSNVPEEITEVLNLNEVNIQYQLDSPFLLSETPGKVAEHFNKVAKLDKIDISTSNINSAIRKLTSDIDYQEGQVETLKEELDKFIHLEKFEIDVEVLEETNKRWLSKILNKNSLDKLIRNIKHIDILIDNSKPLLDFEKPLHNIFEWRDQKEVKENSRKNLDNILDQIEYVKSKIETQQDILSIEKLVNNLLGLYEELNTLKSDKMLLNKALSYINSTITKLSIANSLEAKFQTELDKVKICPFCGNKIK
jgi:exonuclease SbcC